MRRALPCLLLCAAGCTQPAAPAHAEAPDFQLGECTQLESVEAAPESSTVAISLCLESGDDPIAPVFIGREGQCVRAEIGAGEQAQSFEARATKMHDRAQLAVVHGRAGQAGQENRVELDAATVVEVGNADLVARVDFFGSDEELRAWYDAGGAGLGEASACR